MNVSLPLLWDIFCRVIDNFGDIGVCWRLSADLAERGQRVRLWVDDVSALKWMAPGGYPGVEVRSWAQEPSLEFLGSVVIEAFGCELSGLTQKQMAVQVQQGLPLVWRNLEYLSAETHVQRCHRLVSPVCSGPAQGLSKRFYYPGFTVGTGGLLRERGLAERHQRFERSAWLSTHLKSPLRANERVVSLFSYANSAMPPLLDALAMQPTCLFVPPGPAVSAVRQWIQARPGTHSLRICELPFLSQTDFDEMLWASDLNFVRGEDSLVRAIWAGKPFVWQLYPQSGDAHLIKMQAFLQLFLQQASAGKWHDLLWQVWQGWNDSRDMQKLEPRVLQALLQSPWAEAAAIFSAKLSHLPDLASQLITDVYAEVDSAKPRPTAE
jgi:uncharacterized repeat protein (TIGR03837 family)